MTTEQVERVRLANVAIICRCGHSHGSHYLDLFGTPPTTSAVWDSRKFRYGCDFCDCEQLRGR